MVNNRSHFRTSCGFDTFFVNPKVGKFKVVKLYILIFIIIYITSIFRYAAVHRIVNLSARLSLMS